MDCEVIVVGAGVGGLATAALLAARGVNVCLFERQSQVGGCVANFEHFGYIFEPTAGLYSGWEPEGTYDRVFRELSVAGPEARAISPAYVVRLPDGADVSVSEDAEEFAAALRTSFPECADAAIDFYRNLADLVQSRPLPDTAQQPLIQRLKGTSRRFQRFIDIQLQTFTQSPSDMCSCVNAAPVLTAAQRGMRTIRGGAQALADTLAAAFKKSGGVLRLNSPVLRLAYASNGSAIGVDLLSGERVTASRAIVSNLTVWDTYGKLIGPSRTPKAIASHLKQIRAWGAYLLFLSMDEVAASGLDADHFLVLTDWAENLPYAPDGMQFVFSAAPKWDARAPTSERAVTVLTFTEAEEWFSFPENETSHEDQDQLRLESLWNRLHSAMPALGDSVEVIETATPRTFYETTRRRLGMIGAPTPHPSMGTSDLATTNFPNVFMVGDTVSQGFGLEGVCQSAIALARRLAPR